MTQGFEPTRRAIGRIAKEGRKYGVSLGVVTQRPADLDPTVLSQCSTMFAMRLGNERDKDIIGAASGVSTAAPSASCPRSRTAKRSLSARRSRPRCA